MESHPAPTTRGRHVGELSQYRAAAEQYQQRFPKSAQRYANLKHNTAGYCRHLTDQSEYEQAGPEQ